MTGVRGRLRCRKVWGESEVLSDYGAVHLIPPTVLNIPLDNKGQFKLQVYADGFAPTIQTFDAFQTMNDVRMARAVECQ